MKNDSVKKVVATGIGAALFFVLARFVAIPSGIPNTNIALQYGIQAVFAVLFGPVVGALSGFIGHGAASGGHGHSVHAYMVSSLACLPRRSTSMTAISANQRSSLMQLPT